VNIISITPNYEMRNFSYLNSLDLFLDLFHRDFSTVVAGNGEISLVPLSASPKGPLNAYSVTGVRSCHHILRVKHLLSKLRHSDSSVARRSSRSKWREADHEEMQSRERHHVDSEFPEIRVELTGESETSGDTGHDNRDQVVEVTESRGVEFERTEADIVESFVIDTEGLVRVLNKLVH